MSLEVLDSRAGGHLTSCYFEGIKVQDAQQSNRERAGPRHDALLHKWPHAVIPSVNSAQLDLVLPPVPAR